jgi:hypothetical protein
MTEATKEERWADLELHARFRPGESFVEIELFQLVQINDELLYEFEDTNGAIIWTGDIDKAVCLVKGTVRFDACADWKFQEVWHTCHKYRATNLGVALGRAYDVVEGILGEFV